MSGLRASVWVAVGLLALGCGQEREKVSCKDAPLLTYNNFGKGFIDFNCQGCHGSEVTGEARRGAPVEFTFDDVDEVWEHAAFILATSVGDDPVMPPAGGVFEDDMQRLEIWLTCTPEGN